MITLLDILSDNPGAPRQTFSKFVRHVWRDRRISQSLLANFKSIRLWSNIKLRQLDFPFPSRSVLEHHWECIYRHSMSIMLRKKVSHIRIICDPSEKRSLALKMSLYLILGRYSYIWRNVDSRIHISAYLLIYGKPHSTCSFLFLSHCSRGNEVLQRLLRCSGMGRFSFHTFPKMFILGRDLLWDRKGKPHIPGSFPYLSTNRRFLQDLELDRATI